MSDCTRCAHWQVFDSPSTEQIERDGVVVGYLPEVVHCECCELGHGVGTGLFVEHPGVKRCVDYSEVSDETESVGPQPA